ncbi:hypothetical protein JCM10003_1723 [Bacteroides pyogenes JCM 10003]|nr:hypothetical protein JCM10003_1723 [Bacteroides pyogenes JCM 10003]
MPFGFIQAGGTHAITHRFTTEKVYNAIRRVDPDAEITKRQIHEAMCRRGRRYPNLPGSVGFNFRWMLVFKQ